MAVHFVVAAQEAGERLDRLVARHVPHVGRKLARTLFAEGRVSVAGRRVRAATSAPAGAEVVVDWDDDAARPDPSLPLELSLELPTHVVANKPAGQPTAPLRAGELGTLANALVARFPEMARLGHRPREPGLIHRLDTQTSGLVVAARTDAAFRTLSGALVAGRLTKRYLAVTSSPELPDQGRIDAPLAPDPSRAGRVAAGARAASGYARAATTRYRVVRRTHRYVLVELEAPRAFRHQIRAHLAALGAPLVGDVLYGGEPWPQGGDRHALHASYVAWAGDVTLPSFSVSADLPADLAALLER